MFQRKATYRIVFLLLSLLLGLQLYSQRKRVQNNPNYDSDKFHLGFTLGYNNMFFRAKPSSNILFMAHADSVYGFETVTQPGFNLGMIAEQKLFKYLGLRFLPGLSFGQRNIVYQMRNVADYPDSVVMYEYKMLIPSIFIEAPLLLKLNGMRINNYRPYLIGGGNVRYDLETRRKNQKNKGYSIKMRPLDFYFEIGAGLDFYLTYFKLSTELKMSYGLKDVLIHEPDVEYNSVIEELKSKMFLLSLHFE